MHPTEIELTRTETELAKEEIALQTELSRLELTRDELKERLSALMQQAAELAAGGGGQVEELEHRLADVVVPEPDAQGVFTQARAAREAAIAARKQAHARVKQLMGSWNQAFSLVTRHLSAEETKVAHAVSEAKAQEAKRDAAQKAEQAQVEAARRAEEARAAKEALAQTTISGLRRHSPATKAAPAEDPAAKRVQTRVPMQAQIDFHSDHNFFSGFSANISDGGVFVATVNVLPLGTEVDLSFDLPSGEQIKAHGVVRWVREVNDRLPDAFPGMGVQFTSLDDGAHAAIHRFVAQREPMFYEAA